VYGPYIQLKNIGPQILTEADVRPSETSASCDNDNNDDTDDLYLDIDPGHPSPPAPHVNSPQSVHRQPATPLPTSCPGPPLSPTLLLGSSPNRMPTIQTSAPISMSIRSSSASPHQGLLEVTKDPVAEFLDNLPVEKGLPQLGHYAPVFYLLGVRTKESLDYLSKKVSSDEKFRGQLRDALASCGVNMIEYWMIEEGLECRAKSAM